MRSLAFVVALAACGGSSGATVVEVAPEPLPTTPPPPTATFVLSQPEAPQVMRSGDTWVGTYVCGQGQTDLSLQVDSVRGSRVDAVFQFSHAPSGAAGAYRMSGTLEPNGSLRLVPGPWIEQPPGYVTVGMSGVVQGDTYRGRIDNPTCTTFSVHRR
jgi:hypothetical protein